MVVASRDNGGQSSILPSAFHDRDVFRRLLLYGVMVFSSLFSIAILFLVRDHLSGERLLGWIFLDSLAWCSGFFLIDGQIRWIYLSIPFFLPISGPVLTSAGFLIFLFSRQHNYLVDDPILHEIFHPDGKMTRLKNVSLEEILNEDRKIVSAGDILKWGDVSLKQAVIDRLSSEGSSPRAIRVLKGAWNDPDEEVRLFATTVLSRLEKGYQERIRSLERMPDSEKANSDIGKAYFDYALSNLVGQKLSEFLIQRGLSAYLNALRAGESFSPDELLTIGSQAISKENAEVEQLVMDRLLILGGGKKVKILEWMRLYQKGDFEALKNEVSLSRDLFEKDELPDYIDLWLPDLSPGGTSNGK